MAQIDEDPSARTDGLDGFTYFPFLGVPSLGSGLANPYAAYTPYQPGFSSIYLPGYTYRPLLLGLIGRGFRTYTPTLPRRPGVGTLVPIPRFPVPRPVTVQPVPRVGVRVGGHR
jgi:hypothetical protein